jgi:hypothetical protein
MVSSLSVTQLLTFITANLQAIQHYRHTEFMQRQLRYTNAENSEPKLASDVCRYHLDKLL